MTRTDTKSFRRKTLKKNNLPEEENEQQPERGYNGFGYAYAATGLVIAGAAALALIFTVPGIYSLIASVILSIAALTFVNVQKRKNDFPKLKIIRICAYAVFGVAVAVFTGGLIWSAL